MPRLANGYALMCRARPESDVTIELLHYDPDNYRLEHAIRTVPASVSALTAPAADIVSITLTVDESFHWTPGQFIDLHAVGVTRSYSIANLPGDGTMELIVRRYPDGRLSGRLGTEIVVGSAVSVTGPYGALRLRDPERPMAMIAGGSGLGPVLGLLRCLAADGVAPPPVYFATREPFLLDELRELGCEPVLVSGRAMADALGDVRGDHDVYMCGPQGLLDVAQATLTRQGVDPARIFQDRFTANAASAGALAGDISQGEISGAASAGALAGDISQGEISGEPRVDERALRWFEPAGRRATLYEDVTIDTQPSIHRHLTRGWPLHFADGRGTWNDASTALRCADWFAFRDPGGQWERPFYQAGTAAEQQVDGALRSAVHEGLIDDFTPEWVRFLQANLQIPAFVEHGLWFALATAARDCLSDSVATCVCLQAAHKQRSAQAIVLYAMDLEAHLGCELPIAHARQAFLTDPAWQPTRRYLERLAATPDWGEVIIAANLCFEPTVGTLLRRDLGTRAAAAGGDLVTPVLARVAAQEWAWARAWTIALVRFLAPENQALIDRWVADWMPDALAACQALAPDIASVRAYADTMLTQSLAVDQDDRTGPAARPAAPDRPLSPAAPAPPAADGPHDYVGIVMAKSAEGDAVARFFPGAPRSSSSRRSGRSVPATAW